MAAVELVSAVAQQQHHALLTQAPGEESDEGSGRAVRPVHVLEDQDNRGGLAQKVDQLEHGLEQTQLAARVRALVAAAAVLEPGEDRRQLGAAAGGERLEGRMVRAG